MPATEAVEQGAWTAVDERLTDGLPMRAYLAACKGELWAISVHDDTHPQSEDEFLWSLGPGRNWIRSAKLLGGMVVQICEYFAGSRQILDLPVHFRGTPFQKRVWQHMLQIPYGDTISYGELAELAGHPGAFRAVGNANGRNVLGLVVPSHRVIAAGGKLGGYGGSLSIKRRLLVHEATVCGRPSAFGQEKP